MSQTCEGYIGGLVRWEHPDNTGYFYSRYPPITWDFEETISDGTQVHVFGTFRSTRSNDHLETGGCNKTRYWRTHLPVYTPIGLPFVDSYNGWGLAVSDKDGNSASAVIRILSRHSDYFDRKLGTVPGINGCWNANSCSSYPIARGYNFKVVDIIPIGNYSANCQLKIFDSRGLVFTKDFPDSCPTVTITCRGKKEQCPTGTCSVDCGNHICCYNKNGYPVKQISK